jgi:hypothetical protein
MDMIGASPAFMMARLRRSDCRRKMGDHALGPSGSSFKPAVEGPDFPTGAEGNVRYKTLALLQLKKRRTLPPGCRECAAGQ